MPHRSFVDRAGRSRRAAGLLAALLALLAAPAAAAVDCQLACRAEPCVLRAPEPAPPIQMKPGDVRTLQRCREIVPERGRAELRYRHRNRWFTPPQAPPNGVPLAAVFDRYPPDDCAALSPHCLQRRANAMVAGVGGHGIDEAASKPGGDGEPCALGFPCGRLLPPPPAWSFRVASGVPAGTWQVRLLRGTPGAGRSPELNARIDGGVVRADGSWFAPGGHYGYRVVDAGGATRASGEFSLLSTSMAERLRASVARGTAGAGADDEALAWIDALAGNNLEWDAHQRLLAMEGAR